MEEMISLTEGSINSRFCFLSLPQEFFVEVEEG